MGIITSVISFLIVLTVGRHVVSATDCRESNCLFVVQEECQTSDEVICNMKHRPLKQINITAISFPRDVREIEISDAETITISADSISSLEFLDVIEVNDVNTLILLPRSLARGGNPEPITVRIRAVKSVQLHSKTFQDWKGDSRITITDVDDCQLLPFSTANAQFRSLTFSGIRSLAVHESAFSDDSLIEKINIKDIKSLSIAKQAFTSNVTVHQTWIEDIESLTIHSRALSPHSRMTEARLEKVKYLNIEPDGIEAHIGELKVKDVAMETCDENTFGGKIRYLSLSSSHINRTRKHCISACKGMTEVILENSKFDEIETSGICGTVGNVKIKNSKFGTIAKEGLQLNVTKFYIENSTIAEASEEALTVRADNDITIRNCTIDVLQKGAFSSLRVMQGNGTADHRILLDNLHIKHPQNGSLQFDQDQRVIVHDLTLDISCTCDILGTALGLDVSSENEYWIHQPFCVIKDRRPPLGHYLEEFCTEPTTTTPPTNPTNPHRGGRPPLRGKLPLQGSPPLLGGPPQPPQTAGESNIQDPQTIPETRDQTPGDGSDQVRTGYTYKDIPVATITVAVLMVLAVIAFFVRRQFKQRSRAEGQNEGGRRRTRFRRRSRDVGLHQVTDTVTRALLESPETRPTHGEDSRRPIGAPVYEVVEPVDINSHTPDQGVPTNQAGAGFAGTHNTGVKHPERRSRHVFLMPLPPPPPTEAVDERAHGQEDDADDDVYEAVEAPYQEIAECHQQMEQGGPATLGPASLTRPSPCHYRRLNPTQHHHQCLESTTHYDHLIHPP